MRVLWLMKGFLLFFDNRFLRLLLCRPRNKEHEKWQAFFADKLFKELLPFTILTTPFKFLEVIGVVPTQRSLERYPFHPNDKKLELSALALEIQNRNIQLYEQGMDFYSKRPEFRLEHYKRRIDYMLQNEVGRSEFQQFLADDIMVRFSKIEGLEKLIWSYLAWDDLQEVLRQVGDNQVYHMAQLQTLNDLLGVFANGYNFSCFRLLRSMWCSIEAQLLNRGHKTIVPLKKITDLADVDYVHFGTVGGYQEETLRTMTVFTCDEKSKVETRLKIAKQLFLLYSQDLLAKSLSTSASGAGIPKYRHGRVFVCDPAGPKCEVIRVRQLSSQYDLPEGALNEVMAKRLKQLAEGDDQQDTAANM